MIVEEFSFASPAGHKLAATTVLNIDGDPPVALLLHGAGPANRHYQKYIAEHLASHNVSSLRFDHTGWGESNGGTRDAQSLSSRLQEAKIALRQLDQGRARLITGSSMGGHIAVRLLETTKPDALVLFCPAAYAAEAEGTPFNEQFTAILRQPDSWKHSLGFNQLRDYNGKVLIVIGSDDPIIPSAVIDAYEDACQNCTSFEKMILPKAPHALHGWLQQPENAATRQQVLDNIAELVA